MAIYLPRHLFAIVFYEITSAAHVLDDMQIGFFLHEMKNISSYALTKF